MKWMIRVDMEGLTGVVDMNQVIPGAAEYSFGQRMLMHDLQAVLGGLLQHKNDEAWLYDIHFFGRNIDVDRLDPRATVICGKPNYTSSNRAFLDESFNGMILLGLHAKSGTSDALLAHNYEHDIREIKLNDLVVGEIGLEALMAGEANVPLVMVTGDSEGIKETEELLPDTVRVTVKESLGDCSAACYPTSVTQERLRNGAMQCAEKASIAKPFIMNGPVQIKMTFKQGALLDKLKLRLADSFVTPDSLLLNGDSVISAWEKYIVAKA